MAPLSFSLVPLMLVAFERMWLPTFILVIRSRVVGTCRRRRSFRTETSKLRYNAFLLIHFPGLSQLRAVRTGGVEVREFASLGWSCSRYSTSSLTNIFDIEIYKTEIMDFIHNYYEMLTMSFEIVSTLLHALVESLDYWPAAKSQRIFHSNLKSASFLHRITPYPQRLTLRAYRNNVYCARAPAL